jgi:integral membrane protein
MLGMPHGLLFMGYVALALVLRVDNQWIKNNFLAVLAASVIPFGTFVVEYNLNKKN